MNINTRRVSVVAALLVLFGSIIIFRYMSNAKKPPEKKAKVVLAPQVQTRSVSSGNVNRKIALQGTLQAYEHIDIFSEVTGRMVSSAKPFKVGSRYKKGQVLLSLDNSELRLSTVAQRSSLLNAITAVLPELKIDYSDSFEKWENYLDEAEVEKPLPKLPETSSKREKLFITSKNIYSQYYNIKSAESRLAKHTIYAPFSGVLTETLVNTGAIVRANQKVGSLMNDNKYELQATIPIEDIGYVKQGSKVKLWSLDLPEENWSGTIQRIGSQIDPQTQRVPVFINVTGNLLKEGMYLSGNVSAGNVENATVLAASLLVDRKAVYLVDKDSILRLHPVQLIEWSDTTAVVKGIPKDAAILSKPLAAAYDGMKVILKD